MVILSISLVAVTADKYESDWAIAIGNFSNNDPADSFIKKTDPSILITQTILPNTVNKSQNVVVHGHISLDNGTSIVNNPIGIYLNDIELNENNLISDDVHSPAWWDYSWMYRKKITIYENSNRELTDHQVIITVDTEILISEGKMQSDCTDVRFTDYDKNELNYWIESGCGTDLTAIWVKIPYIPALNTANAYMYYGNSQAKSKSNPHNVYDWYDDFSENTLNNYTFMASPGTSIIYDKANDRIKYDTDDDIDISIRPHTLNLADVIMEQDIYVTRNYPSYDGNRMRIRWQGDYEEGDSYTCQWSSGYDLKISEWKDRKRLMITSTNDHFPIRNWYTVKLAVYGNNIKFWIHGSEYISATSNTVNSPGNVVWTYVQADGYADNFKVRKYAYPEPSVLEGTEELY